MKKVALIASLIGILLISGAIGSVSATGNGKDKDPGVWINYGNIRVSWDWANTNPWGGTDKGEGYYYIWEQDRDLDGNYGEGDVTVKYGKYGTFIRSEGDGDPNFGFDDESMTFTEKVIHLTETWVPGVSVLGGVDRFIVKDLDGNGEYVGGFNTVLFWDGVTIESGGSYLFQ